MSARAPSRSTIERLRSEIVRGALRWSRCQACKSASCRPDQELQGCTPDTLSPRLTPSALAALVYSKDLTPCLPRCEPAPGVGHSPSEERPATHAHRGACSAEERLAISTRAGIGITSPRIVRERPSVRVTAESLKSKFCAGPLSLVFSCDCGAGD
jgi:hypothetical protein